MNAYRENYKPERAINKGREMFLSLLLAIAIGVALAATMFFGWSK